MSVQWPVFDNFILLYREYFIMQSSWSGDLEILTNTRETVRLVFYIVIDLVDIQFGSGLVRNINTFVQKHRTSCYTFMIMRFMPTNDVHSEMTW